jgi:hypothetical protein
MYKVVIGWKATAHGHAIGKEMGVNTWAAFGGTDQDAVVDGDFAMLEPEVQGVLKAGPAHPRRGGYHRHTGNAPGLASEADRATV